MVSTTTIKTLFALSGNLCAWSDPETRVGCELTLADPAWSQVRAEICHIRGRRPGSQRFESAMTPEDRDHFANLILMCPNHHQEIDTLRPEKYSVELLTDMKERAEGRSDKFQYSDTQLESMAGSLQLMTKYRDLADDALLDFSGSQELSASASGTSEASGDASGGNAETSINELGNHQIGAPFDRLKDLADVLLEMRHMFNVQKSQNDSMRVPAYGSPETLERTNLIEKLGFRLAPLTQEKAPLPITRALATTFNWSSTILDQAIIEVRELMAAGG